MICLATLLCVTAVTPPPHLLRLRGGEARKPLLIIGSLNVDLTVEVTLRLEPRTYWEAEGSMDPCAPRRCARAWV